MGFALRYKLENLAHYGKQGTERLSEYRGYSHGLKRGWIVSLTSYGSPSAFCVAATWVLERCAETLITDNRLPAFLVSACNMLSMLPFSTLFFGFFLAVLICCFRLMISISKHSHLLCAVEGLNYSWGKKANSEEMRISELASHCCGDICKCFSIMHPHSGIGCAVRLYDVKTKSYVTRARSGDLDDGRERSTESLPPSSSLLEALESEQLHNCTVILCPNTKKARKSGQLDSDINSMSLGDEDRSFLISRLIMDDGKGSSLVGILYVSSKRKNAFGIEDITLYLLLHDLFNHALITCTGRGMTSNGR